MDEFNIDPQYIEYILEYLLPAIVGLFVLLFGTRLSLSQAREIKRIFWPLVDEPTDPAIVALAQLLNLSPAQLVEVLDRLGKQLDPAAPPREDKAPSTEAVH